MKAKKAGRNGLRVSQAWIIWYAVALHTVWGCLLLLSPAVYGPTAMHVFQDMPRALMAAIFFLASGLAVWAVTRRQPSLPTLAALLPQQALLTLSAYGAVAAVVLGQYGDGVARPPEFILADQAPAIIAFVLHTAAVIEIHASTPDRELLRMIRLFRESGPAEAPGRPRAALARGNSDGRASSNGHSAGHQPKVTEAPQNSAGPRPAGRASQRR